MEKLASLIAKKDIPVDAYLSFRPFIQLLQQNLHKRQAQNNQYQYILKHFQSRPYLLQRITDTEAFLAQEKETIALVESAIFPLVTDYTHTLYAFSIPWAFAPFYYSKQFEAIFLNRVTKVTDEATMQKMRKNKLERLYAFIIERLYGLKLLNNDEIVYPATNTQTGITFYHKLSFNFDFVTIHVDGDLPKLDEHVFNDSCYYLPSVEYLLNHLPLHKFSFEGFSILYVNDIAEQAAVAELKDAIVNMHQVNHADVFKNINNIIRNLIGLPEVKVSLIPFNKINDKLLLQPHMEQDSEIAASMPNMEHLIQSFETLESYFKSTERALILSSINQDAIDGLSFLQYLKVADVGSYMLMPLRQNKALLGVLEVTSSTPNSINALTLQILQPCVSLLTQVLINNRESFNDKVEALIKEKFTSLQPSVEWKFKETVRTFLLQKQANNEADVGKVMFENIYPFYGAIDIRGSSIERNRALQKDLCMHLGYLKKMLVQLNKDIELQLLDELIFRNNNFIDRISTDLTTDDELLVSDYIHQDIEPVLLHIQAYYPKYKSMVQDYFEMADAQNGTAFDNQKAFEKSMQLINNAAGHFIDKAMEELQRHYPCYSERYRTDGVEYSIYMGDAISPEHPISPIFLKNTYLWQLKTMAEVGRITHNLEAGMTIKLHTTQLILVHSNPISISFRRDERRFDVDDVYNVRYEILKKRIDKIHLKDSNERLTQPGKIAIVYSNAKDAEQFKEFIQYYEKSYLLKPEIECLELEEKQGVSGLKALRVSINVD